MCRYKTIGWNAPSKSISSNLRIFYDKMCCILIQTVDILYDYSFMFQYTYDPSIILIQLFYAEF